MTKYKIEGNINFYEELFKSLDDVDTNDETQICQITGLPLTDTSVNLECNHHFNYDALYKEIYRQRFDFKTYEVTTLSKTEHHKFNNSNLDYFIKCPYCRNIQFTILPYYKEFNHKQIYGINSLDKTLPNTVLIPNRTHNYANINDYTFNAYGTTFKKGQCCVSQQNILCSDKYVSMVEGSGLLYCKKHYKAGLKQHNLSIKNKANEEKLKLANEKIKLKAEKVVLKDDLIKLKTERLHIKNKLLEEINKDRLTKGLSILKRMPLIKPKVENVVQEIHTIGQYVPDNIEPTHIVCQYFFTKGANKGKPCCCKIVNESGLCKRHQLTEPKH